MAASGGGFSGSSLGSGLAMDQAKAQVLFREGGTFVLLDVPVGTEFGCDMTHWRTAEKFQGVKMIPPGIHYFYWSAVSREGHVAPRTGFFHDFQAGDLLVKRFDRATEGIEAVEPEVAARLKLDLPNLDPTLGPYPYDLWQKWVALTHKLSWATLSRLVPMNGLIQSVTELVPSKHRTNRTERNERLASGASDAEMSTSPVASTSEPSKRLLTSEEDKDKDKLPKMDLKPGTEIRYTIIPMDKYPKGSNPAEITKHSMDGSFQLEAYLTHFKRMYGDSVSSSMSDRNQHDEVLAELQFAFICFLAGQHYESFERWKQLLTLFCSCDDALETHADFFISLITDLHFQIREVPDDFFIDILSCNNFLIAILSRLFAMINTNESVSPRLKSHAGKFKANLSKKFDWEFDDEHECEEDAPVVVELDDAS